MKNTSRASEYGILLAAVAVVAALGLGWLGLRLVRGVSQKQGVQTAVSEVKMSLEDLDANGLLRMIDPEVADPIRLMLLAAGTDGNEAMTAVLTQLCGDEGLDMAQSVLEQMQVEVIHAEVYNRTAVAETLCVMTIEGEEFFRYLTFDLEYLNKKWYIMDVTVSVRSNYT